MTNSLNNEYTVSAQELINDNRADYYVSAVADNFEKYQDLFKENMKDGEAYQSLLRLVGDDQTGMNALPTFEAEAKGDTLTLTLTSFGGRDSETVSWDAEQLKELISEVPAPNPENHTEE